jgi:hypothetical protein
LRLAGFARGFGRAGAGGCFCALLRSTSRVLTCLCLSASSSNTFVTSYEMPENGSWMRIAFASAAFAPPEAEGTDINGETARRKFVLLKTGAVCC